MDLTITFDAADDTVNFQTNATDLGSGDLVVDAQLVNIGQNITTTGDQTYNAPLALQGAVTLSADQVELGGQAVNLGIHTLTLSVATAPAADYTGVFSGAGGITKTGNAEKFPFPWS